MTSTAGRLSKVEQAKADRCGLALAPELADLASRGWEQLDEADLTIRLKWLGIFFRPVTPGRFMVRLRLPNGVLQAHQLELLADTVDRCGSEGSADITTRQNLQLRGLLLDDMAPLLRDLQAVGLTSQRSGHDNPRNITGHPLAGLDLDELIDTRPLVEAIQAAVLAADDIDNLPRKFNIAVGGAADSFLLHNDLAFLPALRDGVLGFSVQVGGFFSGQRNELAVPLGLWLAPGALPAFSLAVLRVFHAEGDRGNRGRARLMYVIDRLGLAGFREAVLQRFDGEAQPFDGDHLVIREPRSLLGIHPQRQAGLHWVGLHVPLGRLDAEGMAGLARLATTYGSGELRLTENQNVLLVGVPSERLEALQAEPLLQRYALDPGPLLAEAVSCTGSAYCGFALMPTKTTAATVLEALQQRLELPHPVRTHWTGCPNSCGQAQLGAIGLMGAKARHEGAMVPAAKLLVGGATGATPALAEVRHKGIPLQQLPEALEQVLVDEFAAQRRAGAGSV